MPHIDNAHGAANMSKNEQITAALMAHINAGKDAKEAIEAVFGEGSYEKLAGMIYDMLRAA
jgi:hypothetical protein